MARIETDFIFNSDAGEAKVDELYSKLIQINTQLNGLGQSSNFGNIIAGQVNLTNKELTENLNLQIKIANQEKATELAAKAAIQTERERLKLEQDRLKVQTQSQAVNTQRPTISRGGGDAFEFSPEQLNSQKQALAMEAERNLNQARITESKKTIDALNNDDELYLQSSVARKATLADSERKLADYKIYQADRAAKAQLADSDAVESAGVNQAAPGRGGFGRIRGFGAIFRAVGSPVNESELNAVSAVAEHLGVTIEGVEVAIAGISSGFLLTAGAVAAAGLIAIQYSRSVREEAERRLKIEKDLAVAYGEQQTAIRAGLNDLIEARRLAEQDRAFNKKTQQNVQDNDIDSLTRQRDILLQNQQLALPNRPKHDALGQVIVNKGAVEYESDPDYAQRAQQIQQLDTQLRTLKDNKEKAQQESYRNLQDSYNQGVDDKKTSREEAARDAAKDAEDAQKALNREIEQGKKKVEELGKTYNSVFESLYSKQEANNPFAKIFADSDKELRKLRDDLRGATPELQQMAEALLTKQTNLALFTTRVNTQLDAFNLRNQASDLRNFEQNRLADYKDNQSKSLRDALVSNFQSNNPASAQSIIDKSHNNELSAILANQISDIVQNAVKNQSTFRGINGTFGGLNPKSNIGLTEASVKENTFGTYYRYDLTQGLDKVYDQLGTGGTISRQKTFEDLTDSERKDYLNSVNRVDTNRDRTFQSRLDQQIDIVNQLAGKDGSQDALDVARRKINSLTQGIDPSKLTENERNSLAYNREETAKRDDAFEREGRQLQKDQLETQRLIAENQKALLQLVEKEGIKAVIELIDKTNGSVNIREGTQPNRKDTEKTYNQD